MKKLTRKSLDELAKKMSVLNESEQQNLVGGAFYYDDSGNFLGEYGTGNNILIANSIYDPGMCLSIASEETVGYVLTTTANAIGISGDIGIYYDPFQYAKHESGQVYVNYNGDLISDNNYYDIVSVLHHEHFHQMTIPDYSGTNLQNEYQAFIYQINHPSFQYVSEHLRSGTMANYERLHNEQEYGYNYGDESGYESGSDPDYGSGSGSGYDPGSGYY